MPISTRHAEIEDIRQLVALWKRFMIEENEAVPNANPAQAERPWTTRLQIQIANSKVIVADNDGVLVGFLAFIDARDRPWVPARTAYVVDIYVAPEARETTAAKRLFSAASEMLRASYAETWTNTHTRNRRMQILLKRAGFEPLVGFEIEGLRDPLYYRLDNRVARD